MLSANLEAHSCQLDVEIYVLTAVWGYFLEKELGMQWEVINDEYGTEIGLYHANNDTTVFPFKSTAKAFRNRDYKLLAKVKEQARAVVSL